MTVTAGSSPITEIYDHLVNDLGFDSVVLSDATATRSLPSASGSGSVPAAALHEAALAALADRFSVVAPATALL